VQFSLLVVVKAQSSAVDKVRTRLAQLDDLEEGCVRQEQDLSQQEYMSRIEHLNSELVQAWHADQRVRALKIAIQVTPCWSCLFRLSIFCLMKILW